MIFLTSCSSFKIIVIVIIALKGCVLHMTKFSDKCKELLAENGTNVYRFSSTSSLERTALQRMITGKRLPNIEFVKAFCHSLRLSKKEEDEVLELYKIEYMG